MNQEVLGSNKGGKYAGNSQWTSDVMVSHGYKNIERVQMYHL